MTTDVTWGYFEQVRRPPEWRTLRGRITYMMGRKRMRSKADLARAAGVNPRQVANQLARIETGVDLELETVKDFAKALGVTVGWLAADEGWPNEEERLYWAGEQETAEPARSHDTDADHGTGRQAAPVRPIGRRPKSGN